MADFRRSVLGLFQQGVDAVNNAVMHVSTATRNKMDELTLQNQRKELMENLANTVYTQWQQGETYPESLTGILEQIKDVNDQLEALSKQEEKPAEEQKDADDAEKPEEVVEAAQEAATPAKEDEPIPTIEVKEEASAWPETPVKADAPQITVPEETTPEE